MGALRSPTAINAAKTHCVHGHEFTPENVYITKRGRRHCRECSRRTVREAHRRTHEALADSPPIRSEDISEYVANNYIPVPESGCWLWVGGWHLKKQYGRHTIRGRYIEAHRLFYMKFKGEIPEGMFVCHKCDTPPCCNPDHLFLGTCADNMADMIKKGRNRNGGKPRRHA